MAAIIIGGNAAMNTAKSNLDMTSLLKDVFSPLLSFVLLPPANNKKSNNEEQKVVI